MSNRIAKYLEPESNEASERIISAVCALLAINSLHQNIRRTAWGCVPDHIKPDAESLYGSFCVEPFDMEVSAAFWKQFFAIMNSLKDVVTARYNELKGSK